ncbi:MAG: CHASE domain-containing protein [Magnetococcales bacterium]|nr:CHASE domain-containing protein [Magnetococcales bacterium]MBF0322274.1 CHASE domain-containing protein [Magnetococcales bacterium]
MQSTPDPWTLTHVIDMQAKNKILSENTWNPMIENKLSRTFDMSSKKITPWIVLTVGFMISCSAPILAYHYINLNNRENFRWASIELSKVIHHGANDEALHLLNDVGNIIELATPLNQAVFKKFCQHLSMRQDGLQFIAWVPHVRDQERVQFETQARTEIPGFLITSWEERHNKIPAATRTSYFPLHYLESLVDAELLPQGVDLGTNLDLWKIMQQAWDSEKVQVSGKIFLYAQKKGSVSIFFIKPLFRQGPSAATPTHRTTELAGFVMAAYNIGGWIEHLISNLIPRGIHFELIDETAPSDDRLLYFHRSRLFHHKNISSLDNLKKTGNLPHEVKKHLQITDRIWLFRAGMDQKATLINSENEMTLAWILFGFGLLATLITAHNSRKKIQSVIHQERYMTYKNVINKIHLITYQEISLEEQLDLALGEFLTIPWLFNQSKGGIFLVDAAGSALRLVAQRGLGAVLADLCATVPFGRCLCGRAIQKPDKILFVAHVDDQHDISHPDMMPHGHYVVPLLSGEEPLGVLTLYLDDGHVRNVEEESLLHGIGNALAALIQRKRSEDAIRLLNQDLERRVLERTSELHSSLVALKRTQERVIQSEKMAALGGLVAGVAHEIKTPVGSSFTVTTYLNEATQTMLRAYQANQIKRTQLGQFLSDLEEGLRIIILNLQRAGDLVQSFKMVAVDQASQDKRKFNVHNYIQDILLSIAPKLRKTRHAIHVQCPETLEIHNHPGALSQILTNLVHNSLIHAFENIEAGTITITVTEQDEQIKLTYADNGEGMDEESVKKVFDPFFTTKRGQGGSGLGMHIVYNLVTQTLQGTIQCVSAPNQGATFHILFPAQGEKTTVQEPLDKAI